MSGVGYEGALAFTVTADTPERTQATMAVTPAMLNPFGTFHAGAMVWFADVTATHCALAGRPIAPDGGGFPVAVDLHVVCLANQRDGTLTATAEPVRRGRQVSVVRTRVKGREGRVLIEMTSTHLAVG